LPAAIPEPDQRPPLTAATTHSRHIHKTTQPQLIKTTSPPDHTAQISNNTAATIPETSPAASLDDLKTLLDNAAEID
jgi:hypothetical protein